MIDWQEGGDPHGVWATIDADMDKYTINPEQDGHWEIGPLPYRPNWITRVLARLLLGWKWVEGK